MKLDLVTTLDRPDLIKAGDDIIESVWPEFMLNDAVANRLFFKLYQDFPQYQFWLLDEEEIVGIGNSIPLSWNKELEALPEEGWDWALEKGFRDVKKKRPTDLLCGLSITINPKYQGKGISARMIRSMADIGRKNHFKRLVIPVRPSLKKSYPLTDIQKYILWKREDRLPFDPWLRVHFRLGAELIKVCNKAMLIEGSIKDWSKWTGMIFPESGKYIIPGALSPVEFDLEKDIGTYTEPNVWVKHEL
jgi:GNAT superfamily N-acetyltransferase